MTVNWAKRICTECAELFRPTAPRARQCSTRCRLWANSVRVESGCLEYTGNILRFGYGQISINNKKLSAHRVAYEEFIGPAHGFVLHRCDNRKCIEPRHLFLGTQKDNMQDCVKKGRFACNVALPQARAALAKWRETRKAEQ